MCACYPEFNVHALLCVLACMNGRLDVCAPESDYRLFPCVNVSRKVPVL